MKLVYQKVCKFNLYIKKTGRGDWKPLFSHAKCWVECDTQGVYATQHAPWKHVECRLRHNDAE